MRFTTSASVALVASLAALGEASHPFHARSGKFHHARGYNNTSDAVSSVFVIPTPLEQTPQVTPSVPLSTGAARHDPHDPQAAASTQTSVEDLTLTYTLGGATTSVVTTTVQRTATNTVFATVVCFNRVRAKLSRN